MNTYIRKKGILNKQPNCTPQGARKEEQTNACAAKGKKITKIPMEIKEMETRKAIEKINETKCSFLEKIKIDR